MAKDLVLLKFSGDNGVRLAALCRPAEGMDVLHAIVGDDPDGEEWKQQPDKSMVAIATEGLVTITDSEDLTMLSFWLATAANWLKTHGG
jgi:hypothetical protein